MKQKLNAKDFILIGVLTALMWIICMIISTIMSVAGPVTNVFYPSVVAIPNGIVMMLLLAKVPKKGVFTICAAIQAILFLLLLVLSALSNFFKAHLSEQWRKTILPRSTFRGC